MFIIFCRKLDNNFIKKREIKIYIENIERVPIFLNE